jgi:hypothetical protein
MENYIEMDEDQRYALMKIDKPALTIAQWFAQQKILLHEAKGIGAGPDLDAWTSHVEKEFPRALRLIDFLEDRLAELVGASFLSSSDVEEACKRVLEIDMESF